MTKSINLTDNETINVEDVTLLIEDLESTILDLQSKILRLTATKTDSGPSRKEQVLAVMMKNDRITINKIADLLGTNNRNISSVMTAIRKDGYGIATDSLGRKYIESYPKATEPVKTILRKSA